MNGSGWAWKSQQDPPGEACGLAHLNLQLACRFQTGGLDCCGESAAGDCNACVDWGTGILCTATAYLNDLC